MAAMLLADFGAEVLQLRAPDAAPGAAEIACNRNKRCLHLDIEAAGSRARLSELLAAADVAVFDHGPRALAELGLDAATLSGRHPDLIHVWTPPFGVRGRWSDLPAHHAMLTGLTGTAFRQGAHADQPVWHVTPLVHYAQGVIAAAAAGAALYRRARTGQALSVTVSGLHAMAQTHCPVRLASAPPAVRGRPDGTSPGHQLYRCGDGLWLFLGCLLPPFYRKALAVLGLSEASGVDMAVVIQDLLATRPRSDWLSLFSANAVPAAPVNRREDWLRDEIVVANELTAMLEDPALGEVEMPGLAAALQVTPGRVAHLGAPATTETLANFTATSPRPQAQAPTSPEPPLTGARVLDLGSLIAGPHAATLLANFGADVVKVEPAEGDPLRPTTGLFINYNRGKRGLGLDLKSPEGRDLFLELASRADVVIDNFRLGVRERLGIGYPALKAVNPRIISCSANTYGSRGPDRALPGFDSVLQARSGLMAAQGGGDTPVYHAIPVNDVATAAVSAFAVIAALYARETGGQGQAVETSLAAASGVYQFAEFTRFAGCAPPAEGGRDCLGIAALDRYYACADGWLTMGCSSPAHFEALAAALGRPDWLERWTGEAAIAEGRDGALAGEIAAELAGRDRNDVLIRLAKAGAPAAPVLQDEAAHRDPFLADNGYYVRGVDPVHGELIASRTFAEFAGAGSFDRPPPGLGEHTAEVLADYGIAPDRIEALTERRIAFSGKAAGGAG